MDKFDWIVAQPGFAYIFSALECAKDLGSAPARVPDI